MPVMLRPKGKARKICWNLIGKPANYKYYESPTKTKIGKRLLWDQTRLER